MTRMSKKGERRGQSPRKHSKKIPVKTGPKKDLLSKGYKECPNAVAKGSNVFIPKIKSPA